MLNAAIKDCPVFGGKLVSFDESKIAGMPGVKKVVKVKDTAVAVVADTWWRAKKALDALPIVWDEAGNGDVSSASIAEQLKEGLAAADDQRRAQERRCAEGHRRGGEEGRGGLLDAVPRARLHGDDELHGEALGRQGRVLGADAEPRGVAGGAVGGLRRSARANARSTATTSAAASAGAAARRTTCTRRSRSPRNSPASPVKLIWSREEDQAHDFYRPISQCKLSAGLDADGKLVGLHVRVSGQSINATLNPTGIVGGKDMRQLQGYYAEPGDAQLGYTVPNLLIEYVMRNTHVPVGPWRGVNTNQNGVYMECFMDEVAKAAGKDPLEFRRALMKNYPKHLAVLNAAAEKGDWGKPLPAGVHRGIAQFMGYGSYSAAVAEVSVSAQGKLKVHRMVLALNCGHAVNPEPDRGAGRGLGRLWPVRRALRRDAGREGPHDQPELRQLRDHAARRDAARSRR